MTEAADEMEMQLNAMRDAKNMHVELTRMLNAEVVNRPAFGSELSAEDRLTGHLAWRTEPASQRQSWKEVVDRFKPPPDKPIPKRWVKYWELTEKEISANEEKARKELGNGAL